MFVIYVCNQYQAPNQFWNSLIFPTKLEAYSGNGNIQFEWGIVITLWQCYWLGNHTKDFTWWIGIHSYVPSTTNVCVSFESPHKKIVCTLHNLVFNILWFCFYFYVLWLDLGLCFFFIVRLCSFHAYGNEELSWSFKVSGWFNFNTKWISTNWLWKHWNP